MEEIFDDNNSNYISLEDLQEKGLISKTTCDKVKLGTSIIEKKYLEKENQYIKYEKIYNTINNYFNNITNISDSDKEEIKKILFRKISEYDRLSRQKITENRFEIISEIGKGGFGKVKLCRDKNTNEIFAMKKLKYDLLINNAQLFHIKTEKDILASNDNIWKVKLNYSFINDGYLYFIMDYYPGGDLLHYMNKKDILTEDEARFYIAEIILAVESLHKNRCIHRDIKPDNIFIDKDGHLKIGDFGLSKLSGDISYPYTYKMKIKNNENNIDEENFKKLIGYSNVGSLLYVAPEVIEKKGYGKEIDWWSVGIIFYEMLVGFPPFWSDKDTPKATGLKLKNFKKYLNIPKGVKISDAAKKLIFDFLSEKDKRLGLNGIDEIKNHIFFKDFDWEHIRQMKPPFVPKLIFDSKGNYKFMKRKSLKIYTSKENINSKSIFELKQEKDKENKLKKINLSFYDFYFNKELVELKNNIENNLIDLIKKEIENYSKSSKSMNITLEETSTEEILSLKSNESGKKKKNFLSKSYYYTDIKSKKINSFIGFNKLNNYKKHSSSRINIRNSIKIIPIRNLMNSLRENSTNKKTIKKKTNLDISLRTNSSISNFKDNASINSMKINYPKKNNIFDYKGKAINLKENVKKDNNYYNKKMIKVNGKLIMIKKNIGKYLLEQ